jgi:hypothetical protein
MLLEPTTKQLQSPKMNIERALDLINAVRCNIDMSTDEKLKELLVSAATIDEIEIPVEKLMRLMRLQLLLKLSTLRK